MADPNLEDLENDEMRALVDAVHSLRDAGLEDILQLPQIVVCGYQSCGKSSVLESITEIPFPRNEGMCTRFPTTITLRRSDKDSTTVKIIPDPKRPDEKSVRLRSYSKSLTRFSQLPKIIDEVTEMASPSVSKAETLAFSRNVLSVEVSGPNWPNLTVVDLPGLIRVANDQQNREDISMINDVVDSYMKQPRTIVLAVIQASVDHTNQDIIEKVKDMKANDRTLGIITKPDCLESGSVQERWWVELAHNRKDVVLMGWHILRNR